jgi:hypothetical protein
MSTQRNAAAFGLNFIRPLTACALIAGCSADGSASPVRTGLDVTSPATTAPLATPATTAPMGGGPTSMEAGVMVLRGTIVESVEVACRILQADNSDDRYQLVGLPDNLARLGTRVEVHGHVAEDMVSFCMEGTIFQVDSARRL